MNSIIDKVSDYVIRPAYNYGQDNNFSNLRSKQTDCIFTLQIFKSHQSTTDIEFIAITIKQILQSCKTITLNDISYNIKSVNLIKGFESDYSSISVQFLVDIM